MVLRNVVGRTGLFLASVLIAGMMLAGAAGAVEPDEILKDPALEARARNLSAELRCVVCQNQSIDDSHAPLARDLRIIVRERLKAGDSDQEVLDFVVARYGEFVLLRPPFSANTVLLWLTPVLVLIAGLWLAYRVLRGRGGVVAATAVPTKTQALTPEEEAKLRRVLEEN